MASDQPPSHGERFRSAHESLDLLLAQIERASTSDSRTRLAGLWLRFVSLFRDHLLDEQLHLLPALLVSRDRDARTILAEHRHLNRRVADLGDSIDRGDERPESIRAFVGELDAHGRRKAELYRWLDARLPHDVEPDPPDQPVSAAEPRLPPRARRP